MNDSTTPIPLRAGTATRIVEAAEYTGVTPWFVEVKIRSGGLP